jgi:uncharacterized protein involved in exopolysaccharide biosynthesis
MLHKVEAAGEAGRPILQADLLTVDDLAWFARRYAAIVVLAAVAAVGVGLLNAVMQQPIYTATAQLLIDPKPALLLREQVSEGNAVLDTPQIESQIAVIKSQRVLGKVADKHRDTLARLRESGKSRFQPAFPK